MRGATQCRGCEHKESPKPRIYATSGTHVGIARTFCRFRLPKHAEVDGNDGSDDRSRLLQTRHLPKLPTRTNSRRLMRLPASKVSVPTGGEDNSKTLQTRGFGRLPFLEVSEQTQELTCPWHLGGERTGEWSTDLQWVL